MAKRMRAYVRDAKGSAAYSLIFARMRLRGRMALSSGRGSLVSAGWRSRYAVILVLEGGGVASCSI